MNEQGNEQRDDWRNKDVFDPKRHKEFLDYARGAALFAVLTVIGLGVFYLADKSLIGGYWTNIISTVLGAVLTIVILDKRNDYRAEREFKERLILQMGSPDNTFAVEAVRLLRQKGWLEDGSLKKAMLWKANLKDANLKRAILQNADLWGANLQSSDLRTANLESADLWESNLQNADLKKANLQRSNLWEANLQGADLTGVEFSLDTVLPDTSHWTPDRDLREFTHPNEWQAEQLAKQPNSNT